MTMTKKSFGLQKPGNIHDRKSLGFQSIAESLPKGCTQFLIIPSFLITQRHFLNKITIPIASHSIILAYLGGTDCENCGWRASAYSTFLDDISVVWTYSESD